MRQVWPDTVVEENNLNKNISLLQGLILLRMDW
jgi:DNA-binding winged helix-turn-helix (wHTH) protein